MLPATKVMPYGRQDYLDDASWVRLLYVGKTWLEAGKGELPEKDIPDDFKKYDYYTHEFGDYYSQKQLAEELKADEETVGRLCCKGCFNGAEYFELAECWVIPEASVKAYLEKQRRK